jgi:pantoate--beta-alanine ligase
MGALHDGHRALIDRARRRCRRVVVSIFVNPAQFGPRDDYATYPRAWRQDREMCRQDGVDLLFAPPVREIYPDGPPAATVHVGPIGDLWEGASRPGHFDGVATVVLKLFNIVSPDLAVFGQKDYQQSVIIRRLAADFHLPIRIVIAPTVRGPDGLALSSRNAYLDSDSRSDANRLHQALADAARRIRGGDVRSAMLRRMMAARIEESGRFAVDYIAFCDPMTLAPKKSPTPPLVILAAVRCRVKGPSFGRRYIDNVIVH